VKTGETATHSLSLYKAPSGALVFGSGTVQWSWGLDSTNAWNSAGPNGPTDPTMQQATVNLMADMGAQPATLQSGLVATPGSTDTTPPTATVTTPSENASLSDGSSTTISGTATDAGGGVVAAVEVSTDGGATWHTASGTSSWTYQWTADGEPSTTIKARAVDDSGNIGAPSAARTVAVSCPCSIFNGMTPEAPDSHDINSVELGIKFRSDVAGQINGIRFYKATTNTGTHVGSVWTSSGTLLAQATFTGESSSGWQQVNFASPVAIQPNTTYVAAYFAPNGHYSQQDFAVNNPPAVGPNILSSPPLHVLPDNGNGNGLYQYTSSSTFPQNTYQSENYWVDVTFTPSGPTQPPGPVTNVSATAGALQATVNWTPPTTGGAVASYKITPYIGSTAQTPTTVNAPATSKTITGLTGGATYTFTVTPINEKGNGPESAPSNPVTPTIPNPPGAPTGLSATAGALQATVSWNAPASDGGSPITEYRITPYIGSSAQTPTTVAAPATSKAVTGLTPGTTYTFKVVAINAAGPGPESTASNAVTPTTPNPPGPPTAVTASSGGQQATVSWTAPASDGGSPITSYVVIPYIGSTAQTPTTVNPPVTSTAITGLTPGTTYTFKVAAVNVAGQGPESTASNSVTPSNLAVDQVVTTHQSSPASSISSPSFSTTAPGERLLAFISSDGPPGTQSFSSVTGGGLTWQLRSRSNTQPGTAEIWQANATAALSNATVTATRASGSYTGSITVVAISGADQVIEGATASAGAATGAPSVSLTSTRAGSWTWGVGDDWDNATEREVGPNQTKVDEFLAPTGDTFWVQRQTATTALTGTPVTLNDTAPTADHWNLAAIEVLPAAVQNPPPAAPTLSSTVPASPANQNSPKIVGSAVAGSQVSIYTTSGCTGTPLATGSAAELGTGITVTVPDNSTTAFRATATVSGNTSACSTPLTYVEDSTPPDTTITSGPTGTTNNSTPTFGFSSSESGSSFECRFDTSAFAACSGPGATHTPTTALADGEHVFEVRAKDAAANVDPTPASRSFTVNTVIPPAPTLSSTVPASPANQSSPKIVGSALAGSQVSIYTTSGCTGTPLATGSAAELAAGITVTVPDNSTSAFRATATTFGNISSCSAPLTYVEDSAAPQTQIATHPPALSASASASFEFSGEDPGGSGVASLQCRLDSTEASAWATCTSPKSYSGLADGAHRFEVRATDQAGNTDATPATFEWQIDTTPPTATIDAGPTGTTNDSTPTFEFHSSEAGSTFACSIDTGTANFGPCSGPGATHTPTTPLADGAYTFRVRATDPAGNPGTPATRSFTVAAGTPPGAPTAVTAIAKSSGAQLSWTAPSSSGGTPISSYRITPYIGSAAQAATTTGSTATTAGVGGLTNGTAYTFNVAAINASGPGPDSTASAAITPYDTIFDLATPATVDSGDTSAVELGVKFRSDVGGTISGIRFYKATTNTGTHVGSLWSSSGTLLSQATFSGETASGWQQVKFSSPVAIQANTTYVAGYLAPKGHYSVNGPTLANGVDNAPLHAIANGTSANGVYIYSSTARFPTNTFQSANYWVDVLFTPTAQPPGPVTNVSATAGPQQAAVTWTPPTGEGETVTGYRITPYIGSTAQTPTTVTAPATSKTVTGLTAGTEYTFTVTAINSVGAGPESAKSNSVTPTGAGTPEAPTGVTAAARNKSALVSWTPGGNGGSQITGYRIIPYIGSNPQAVTNVSGESTSATVSGLSNGTSYTFTVVALTALGTSPASTASNAVMPRATIFEQAEPVILEAVDTNSVELGVKFTSETAGTIRGIRFYKAPNNTGTHVVSLWSAAGALLAQATASGETESGWQEVLFASPVAIAANTIYVASYHAPEGHYSATSQAFETSIDNPPLHAIPNSAGSNGVYAYSSSSVFPSNTFNATNYWVDVLFTP
jgi:hypothetical protein